MEHLREQKVWADLMGVVSLEWGGQPLHAVMMEQAIAISPPPDRDVNTTMSNVLKNHDCTSQQITSLVKHSVHIVKMIKDQSFAFNLQGFFLAFLGMIKLSLEQIEPLLIMTRQIQPSQGKQNPCSSCQGRSSFLWSKQNPCSSCPDTSSELGWRSLNQTWDLALDDSDLRWSLPWWLLLYDHDLTYAESYDRKP